MSKQKVFYKIVEKGKDGIYFLFHGIDGTRRIPVGTWVKADKKENVYDGSGITRYTSGIHVVDGYEETLDYMKKFRRKDRIIVACQARGLRPKTHSRHKVYLADEIKILEN